MFITPIDSNNNNSPFNTYDPLLTNHLTSGQMGYMPSAQFMTPAQYGAFRTVPSGNYVTGQENNPSLLYNFLIANRGFNIINTYNPAVNIVRRNIMAHRTIADAQAAVALGLGETGISVGAGMLAGGIGGAALGLGVGALAGLATAPYLDRIRHAREIQRASMARITFGNDAALGLGQGFNMQSSYRIGTSLRRMSAGDPFFNKEDYDNMMRIGMDAGMFDFANNADQYIRTLKTVKKNFKTMMTLFETLDMEDIGRQMKRMQAMGATNSQMGGIAALEKTYSRMLGISHSDAINMYGQQGALIANNMGIAGIYGSSMNLSIAGRLEAARRLGLLSATQVSAVGGVSGGAQTIMANDLNSLYGNKQDLHLLMALTGANGDPTKFDPNKLRELIHSKESITELTSRAMTNLQQYLSKDVAGGVARLDAAGTHFLDNMNAVLGKNGAELVLASFRMKKAAGLGLTYENILKLQGYTPEQINAHMAMMDPRALQAESTNLRTTKRELVQDYVERTKPAVFRDIVTKGRKLANALYDNTIGGLADKHNIASDREENIAAGVIAGASSDLYGNVSLDDALKMFSQENFAKYAAAGDFRLFGLMKGDVGEASTAMKNAIAYQNIYSLYEDADNLNKTFSGASDKLYGLFKGTSRIGNASFMGKQRFTKALQGIKLDHESIKDGSKSMRAAIIDAAASALQDNRFAGKRDKAFYVEQLSKLSDNELYSLISKTLVNDSTKQTVFQIHAADINSKISNDIKAAYDASTSDLHGELKSIYGDEILGTLGIGASALTSNMDRPKLQRYLDFVNKIAKDGSINDNSIDKLLNNPEYSKVIKELGLDKDDRILKKLVGNIKQRGDKITSANFTDLNNAMLNWTDTARAMVASDLHRTLNTYGIDDNEFKQLIGLGKNVTTDAVLKVLAPDIDKQKAGAFAADVVNSIHSGNIGNLYKYSQGGTSAHESIMMSTGDPDDIMAITDINKQVENLHELVRLFGGAMRDGLLGTAGIKAIDKLNNSVSELNDKASLIINKMQLPNPYINNMGGY